MVAPRLASCACLRDSERGSAAREQPRALAYASSAVALLRMLTHTPRASQNHCASRLSAARRSKTRQSTLIWIRPPTRPWQRSSIRCVCAVNMCWWLSGSIAACCQGPFRPIKSRVRLVFLLVPDVLIPWVPVQLWNKDQLVQLEEYGVQSKGDNKVRVHPTFHALF